MLLKATIKTRFPLNKQQLIKRVSSYKLSLETSQTEIYLNLSTKHNNFDNALQKTLYTFAKF